MTAASPSIPITAIRAAHARWVRLTHWIGAASVLTLIVSGFTILMVHPRLYWGEVGNDLTPALIELPISRNHRHGGWAPNVPFDGVEGAPISAVRTYPIFNQNGWARSLHFLAAWFLALTGAIYLVAGIGSGHFRRHLLPRVAELSPPLIWRELLAHLRRAAPPAHVGPPYGLLQKLAYTLVVFLALPVMILSGLTMSPAVTAGYPILLDIFGGSQSARTIHFFVFALVVLFIVAHLAMVLMSGFRRQLRAMTLGGP